MQAKNVKRPMTAQGRRAVELRQGARAQAVPGKRRGDTRGGRSGVRAAIRREA